MKKSDFFETRICELEGYELSKLRAIYDYLSECGIDAEIRSDRLESYVNVGNVKRLKERMQFWIPDNGCGVDMYVGTKMGKWYSESSKLPYLVDNGRYKEKENKIAFPTLDIMKEFVGRVSKM